MTPASGTSPRSKLRRLGVQLVSVATLLGVWYVVTEVAEAFDPLFLPSPVAVGTSGIELLTHDFQGSTLFGHAWASVQTVLGGWLLAILIGVPLGLTMGWSRWVNGFVGPVFQLLRPIPPIAWIPLAIVWFGIGEPARLFVVFLAASIPCVINAYEGVRQVDPLLVKAARTLGASRSTTLRTVVLPAAAPLVFTGARISLGNAWMTLVGAELVAATSGLGYLLLNARRALESDLIFVAMATIGLLGALMGIALRTVERRILPWEVRDGQR